MAKTNPIATPTLRVAAAKPKMTIYFALLIIALGAMLFACLFLYLEIRRFGGFGAVPGRVSQFDRTGHVPLLAAEESSVAMKNSNACLTRPASA
jgi:uncharacterized membrane protein